MRINKTLSSKHFQKLFALVQWMEAAPEDFLEDWQMEELSDQMNEIAAPAMAGYPSGRSFTTNHDAVEVETYDDDQNYTIVIRRQLK